jgi:hypothetical protein
MTKGKIKITTGIVPPSPPRVEHEVTLEVQGLMEDFESRFAHAPALSRFDLRASPATNIKKVILKR